MLSYFSQILQNAQQINYLEILNAELLRPRVFSFNFGDLKLFSGFFLPVVPKPEVEINDPDKKKR